MKKMAEILGSKPETEYGFVIVSQDMSGLGWAKKLADEGENVLMAVEYPELFDKIEPDELERLEKVGEGIVPIVPLDKVFAARKDLKECFWIFDQNYHSDIGQKLHDEGFKVLGGSKLADDMEHDREFGVALVKKAGIAIPETQEFSSPEEGIAFLEQNDDRAFVFKPNDDASGWKTYVPDSDKADRANEELRTYLNCLKKGNSGGFILQERIKGVEANFEAWLYRGKPYFAFCDLECKKKLNDDLGGLVGGAQDIGFAIPVDSRAIKETVGKLLTLPEFKNYTGFLDMNVIISDRAPHFLEFCARKGYPAHPTLFYALALSKYADIIKDMLNGTVDNFYRHFKHGFAAGITLNADSRDAGVPIYISEEIEPMFYPYDTYSDGEHTLLARADMEVGVITGHGYTVKEAAESALENMERVNFPDRGARSDLDHNDYPSAPQGRYDALVAMEYLVSTKE